MRRALIRDAELAFDFRGSGEPILFIHGALLADGMLPLSSEPALTRKYLVLRTHRRGFGASSRIQIPWSMEQHALDALDLLDHLGLHRVHLVGHSIGSAVALEMALDFPDRVGSLVLLEPMLLSAASAAPLIQAFAKTTSRYERGEDDAAIDDLLSAMGGPGYHKAAATALSPTAFQIAMRDAETVFAYELPAFGMWHLSQHIAARLAVPTLVVTGAATSPVFTESQRMLRQWCPDCQGDVVAGAGHSLHLTAASQVATLVARFVRRHPLAVSTYARPA